MDTVTLVRERDPRRARASPMSAEAAAAGRPPPGRRLPERRQARLPTGRTPRRGAALVDALARDGEALLEALEGEPLRARSRQAATLLATVLGQDLEDGPDGRIRIARRVAPDRVISTVDPDARHGHKTDARGFDGYKGHVALDPDAELVTATAVTPGNAGDASVVPELLADVLALPARPGRSAVTVYGDSAYGAGAVLEALDAAGAVSRFKVQPPSACAAASPRTTS